MIAVLLFVCQIYAQQHVSVSLSDSKSPAVVSNAIVKELISGQTLLTDLQGEGEFAKPFPAGTNVFLRVTAPGFPTHYFERYVPDYGANSDSAIEHALELTQKNEFLSPSFGPAGGAKLFKLATGYFLYSSRGDSNPTEYYQTVSMSLPIGAVTGSYRVGLSVIPGAGQAENLMNVLQLGDSTSVMAQFRLEWLDMSGSPAEPLDLKQALRIKMSAAALFSSDLPEGWQVSLYKFNESSTSWDSLAPESSGIDADGLMWADVTTSGYYSFMARNTETE